MSIWMKTSRKGGSILSASWDILYMSDRSSEMKGYATMTIASMTAEAHSLPDSRADLGRRADQRLVFSAGARDTGGRHRAADPVSVCRAQRRRADPAARSVPQPDLQRRRVAHIAPEHGAAGPGAVLAAVLSGRAGHLAHQRRVGDDAVLDQYGGWSDCEWHGD